MARVASIEKKQCSHPCLFCVPQECRRKAHTHLSGSVVDNAKPPVTNPMNREPCDLTLAPAAVVV